MASTDDLWAIRQTLSHIQRSQAEILTRLKGLEEARAEDSDHHKSLLRHTNYMVNALNAKVEGLNLHECDSAKDRAFAVTEVLENILAELPVRDLLFAQRIAKRFHSVIQTSPKLQRALFFLPDPVGTEPRLNPLLASPKFFEGLDPFFMKDLNSPDSPPGREESARHRKSRKGFYGLSNQGKPRASSMKLCRQKDGSLEVLLEFHPFHDLSWDEKRSLAQEMYPGRPMSFYNVVAVMSELRRPRDVRGRGSWRRMLICQPPGSAGYVTGESPPGERVCSEGDAGTLLSLFSEWHGNK
ncbi:hypothetical protein LTR85_009621 [Meristemomyces frigidus]|nr:hypothetical protein LTR85_009621 [Meristemomyces frigidus]